MVRGREVTLKDLEQLQHEVIDLRTRLLVKEVVKAYEAGALRAATVSLWIAVVADLTNKIRYLADSGDGEHSGLRPRVNKSRGRPESNARFSIVDKRAFINLADGVGQYAGPWHFAVAGDVADHRTYRHQYAEIDSVTVSGT